MADSFATRAGALMPVRYATELPPKPDHDLVKVELNAVTVALESLAATMSAPTVDSVIVIEVLSCSSKVIMDPT